MGLSPSNVGDQQAFYLLGNGPLASIHRASQRKSKPTVYVHTRYLRTPYACCLECDIWILLVAEEVLNVYRLPAALEKEDTSMDSGR